MAAPDRLITASFRTSEAGTAAIPIGASRPTMAERTDDECSPMPPVNTTASAPPRCSSSADEHVDGEPGTRVSLPGRFLDLPHAGSPAEYADQP